MKIEKINIAPDKIAVKSESGKWTIYINALSFMRSLVGRKNAASALDYYAGNRARFTLLTVKMFGKLFTTREWATDFEQCYKIIQRTKKEK